MKNPTVKNIVGEYLLAKGFDGLWHCDAPCGCALDDLEPCGNMSAECKAGHFQPCNCDEGCDFHIGPERKS